MPADAPVFSGRSSVIDALRGLAALSVACYHINRYGPLPEPASQLVPSVLAGWFDHGWIGVQIFFVISGFVIAYSVRNARVTPAYVGNYALRRSIRLDPPYWATIVLVLAIHWVMALRLGFESPLDVPTAMEVPLSWKLVGAHMLYVQNILGARLEELGRPGFENLSAGFWTLCIEVQFYLLYVCGFGFAQRFPCRDRRTPADAGAAGLLTVFAPIALLSLFFWNGGPGSDSWFDPGCDHWITHFFCMFFLGCAAWWALDGRIAPRVFWAYVALVAVRLASVWSLDLCAALVTGTGIYLIGRAGRLGTALRFAPLQYLGKISYSLYLVHFPVAHIVTTVGYRYLIAEGPITPRGAALWLLLALLASLGAAHLLYRYVEAPSVRLAARLQPMRAPAAVPVAAPATA